MDKNFVQGMCREKGWIIMNIPYFSIITTPVSLIVFCLLLLFIGCFSYVAQGVYIQEPGKLKSMLGVIIPIFLTVSLIWIFIGDSTSWSEPIGLWLRGK